MSHSGWTHALCFQPIKDKSSNNPVKLVFTPSLSIKFLALFTGLCISHTFSRRFCPLHVFPRLALINSSHISTSLIDTYGNHVDLHAKAEINVSCNYIVTHSWSNLWNTCLIVSFNASSLLSSALTISASFSSISDVQYRLKPFFCDCRVYLSGILRTESGTSSW